MSRRQREKLERAEQLSRFVEPLSHDTEADFHFNSEASMNDRKDPSAILLHYVDRDGKLTQVEAHLGDTLMRVATSHSIVGIDGDCGGNCACGTCHVKIKAVRALNLAPPDPSERDLLAFLGSDAEEGHRLGCQIPITAELDGATIVVATG